MFSHKTLGTHLAGSLLFWPTVAIFNKWKLLVVYLKFKFLCQPSLATFQYISQLCVCCVPLTGPLKCRSGRALHISQRSGTQCGDTGLGSPSSWRSQVSWLARQKTDSGKVLTSQKNMDCSATHGAVSQRPSIRAWLYHLDPGPVSI